MFDMKKLLLITTIIITLPFAGFAHTPGGAVGGSLISTTGMPTSPLITTGNITTESSKSRKKKLNDFVIFNKPELASDISKGEGEYLESLADLIDVEDKDKPHFFKILKQNFNTIYKTDDPSAEEVVDSINDVMKKDEILKKYALKTGVKSDTIKP